MIVDTFPITPELIGTSPATEQARRMLARGLACDDPVLISTEIGLDAVAVARALHEGSPRDPALFLTVDCTAPVELDRSIHAAAGGTLVLINLGGLPDQQQGRLALAMRDGHIEVPGRVPVTLEARLIATVCGNVDDDIREGKLRRELCGRFALRLDLPPLRHRPADLPTLIGCVIAESATAWAVPVPTFTREALSLLAALPWRRNLDELREVLDVLVRVAAGGTLRLDEVLSHVPIERMSTSKPAAGSLREARIGFEREFIAAVLDRHQWRMEDAARTLGIQRTNLYRKVRQLGIGRARQSK